MFTRRVIMQVKADAAAEFERVIELQVLPPLRAQKGCRHEETFVISPFSEAVINSYWDTQEYAEAYSRMAYPDVLKALAGVLDGVPRVEMFQISSSTFHELTANRRVAYRATHLARG